MVKCTDQLEKIVFWQVSKIHHSLCHVFLYHDKMVTESQDIAIYEDLTNAKLFHAHDR